MASNSDHVSLQHVGIIMDGNRRWAKSRGMVDLEGHRAGYQALMKLLPAVKQAGVPYVTIYAFSTENWKRTQTEVQGLMKLLKWVVTHELQGFIKEDIRIRLIGARDDLSADILSALETAEMATKNCTSGTLGICFNYGGEQEIADAVRSLIKNGVATADITPELLMQHLYAPDIPPVDLVIRTSGEQRLSGFMLLRAAYAELYFTDVLWPDFDDAEFKKALAEFAGRQRRFGS